MGTLPTTLGQLTTLGQSLYFSTFFVNCSHLLATNLPYRDMTCFLYTHSYILTDDLLIWGNALGGPLPSELGLMTRLGACIVFPLLAISNRACLNIFLFFILLSKKHSIYL